MTPEEIILELAAQIAELHADRRNLLDQVKALTAENLALHQHLSGQAPPDP